MHPVGERAPESRAGCGFRRIRIETRQSGYVSERLGGRLSIACFPRRGRERNIHRVSCRHWLAACGQPAHQPVEFLCTRPVSVLPSIRCIGLNALSVGASRELIGRCDSVFEHPPSLNVLWISRRQRTRKPVHSTGEGNRTRHGDSFCRKGCGYRSPKTTRNAVQTKGERADRCPQAASSR